MLDHRVAVAALIALSACHKPAVPPPASAQHQTAPVGAAPADHLPDAGLPPDTQEKSVQGADPEVNAKFIDPNLNVNEWVRGFEGESREVFVERQRIVQVVNPQPGQTIADIGAGTGLFSFLFADAVGPKGKVFAVDVSPKFLRHIAKKAKQRQQPWVHTIEGSATSPKLPAAAVDRVFICDTYHHFEKPMDMLAAIAEALRPQGEVVLVDFKRESTSSAWTKKHVRAGEADVTREFESAGFVLKRRADFLRDNYILVFEAP